MAGSHRPTGSHTAKKRQRFNITVYYSIIHQNVILFSNYRVSQKVQQVLDPIMKILEVILTGLKDFLEKKLLKRILLGHFILQIIIKLTYRITIVLKHTVVTQQILLTINLQNKVWLLMRKATASGFIAEFLCIIEHIMKEKLFLLS